ESRCRAASQRTSCRLDCKSWDAISTRRRSCALRTLTSGPDSSALPAGEFDGFPLNHSSIINESDLLHGVNDSRPVSLLINSPHRAINHASEFTAVSGRPVRMEALFGLLGRKPRTIPVGLLRRIQPRDFTQVGAHRD